MKKLLIVIVGILLILGSCKKSEPLLPVNTISATIGGVNMDFVASASYLGTPGTALYRLDISRGPNINASPEMDITFATNGGSITKATYTQASRPVASDVTYWAPQSQGYKRYVTDPNGVQPFKTTITSISSTNIQGTFSGILIYIYDGSTIAITNGRFNVNIN